MQHHFDIEIAKQYGVNVATFLTNIAYWTEINIANERHFYDERYWTYNTQKAFCVLFPYWSRQEIRTIIKTCIEKELIMTGNYNEKKYDRKTWYALSDKGLALFPRLQEIKNSSKINIGCNQPKQWLESTKGLVASNPPIADSNTNIKTEREPLPDNFLTNPVDNLLLTEAAKRTGFTEEQLLSKFKNVQKAYGTKSADWHASLATFLINEKITVLQGNDKNFNEPHSTVKFWEPGNPDFDRVHGST